MKLEDIKDMDPEKLKDLDMNAVLSTMKESLSKDTISIVSEMKNSAMQRYVQYLVNRKVENAILNDMEKQNLYLLIYILQTLYNYSGVDTGVSDYDYDRLYELLKQGGEELITTPILNGKIVHHKYKSLRGTLSKIYVLDENDTAANESRDSLQGWVKSREKMLKEAGYEVNLWEEEIYVFPKWDGVSIEFEFNKENELVRALTRGNTETNEAQDVTFVFKPIENRIKDPNMNGKEYGLKTEVMMHDFDLETLNRKLEKPFKSTRSVISSIVNSDVIDGRVNLLEVVGLRTSQLTEDGETLQELASNVFDRPFIKCRLMDIEQIRKFAFNHTNVNGLNCDGAVIYLINEEYRKVLGRKDHKNQYEVAFKFNEEIGYSEITGIDFKLTQFGRIFPVANFKPLKMKGNTVQNVSLGSIARFSELKLAKGDKVKVLYEIIPYIVFDRYDEKCKRSGNPMIEAPNFCPECGEPLEKNPKGTILLCVNPDCKCRQRGKILNYSQKLGIPGIGPGTVDALFEAGIVTKITDLYKLRDLYDEIIKLEGFNEISVSAMIHAIEEHGTIIPADLFMGAIGIEAIGQKTFQKVFEMYTIEDLIEFAEDDKYHILASIPGIKDLTSKKIITGIKENQKLIEKLLKKYVTVTYDKKREGKFIAVFHKIRSVITTELIESYGGIVEDNLTKKTSFLIVPNGFKDKHSATSDKARKYEIPIVEIDKVEDFIEKTCKR
jgi:DNA ligase (NAD+)